MTRDLPALPLRLAAEPYAKRSISSSCVALGVHVTPSVAHGNLEVAVIADDDGIRAFCISSPVSRRVFLDLLGLPPSSLSASPALSTSSCEQWKSGPLLCLVRSSSSSNDMEWHIYHDGEEFPVKASDDEVTRYAIHGYHDGFVAKLLTESIRLYYAQQILEPSVRGFLSVLEKQFARSDLYLFELLQNAVDDGASVVRFSSHNVTGKQKGLRVSHNGRSFTPLDVLGLSSVGLSTKSREGKRTIGFMGVGFKAVYKRYSRVVIDDGTYAFAYEKPVEKASSEATPGYGWVMQPLWIDESNREKPASGTEGWCHFQLERPAGGMAAVEKDLAVLPLTAPPLLGRAALEKTGMNGDSSWTLDWNGKIHSITRTALVAHDARSSSFAAARDRSEVVTVNVTDRAGHVTKNRWLFISHKYTPSQQAADSYRNHTKRSHAGEEEVCGFVRLGGEDGRTPLFRVSARSGSLVKGIVHSVLPTKLRMPVPMNVQGSWLLSVDRQEVQDLGDNEWNRDLVQRLPMLIANFFRWAAHERLSTSAHYGAICKLLPTLIAPSPSSTSSSTEFLGQTLSLERLERVFFSERVLPVALPSEQKAESTTDMDSSAMDIDTPTVISGVDHVTGYYEGEHSIWVPPSWFKFLGAGLLRGWLGKRPLRSDLLGGAAFNPFFSSKSVIGQLTPLPNRKEKLAHEIGVGSGHVNASNIGMILRLMAAVGAAYDGCPEESMRAETNGAHKKGSSTAIGGAIKGVETNGVTQASAPSPAFPSSTTLWPFFLTESGNLYTLDKVILPSCEFAIVPEHLRVLLRPFFTSELDRSSEKKEQHRHQYHRDRGSRRGRGSYNGGKNRGGSRSQTSRRLPQKTLLHPMLEAAIYKIDSGDTPEDLATTACHNEEDVMSSAASFLSRARAETPSNIITVAAAASNLFAAYSKLSVCQEEHVSAVLRITEFALSTNNPSLLSHVLVDSIATADARASSSLPAKPFTAIVPAREAYIGRALDEGGPGADLENFSGFFLRFISSQYNTIAESAVEKRKLLRLFDLAGVQSGLSAAITAIVDLEKGDRQVLVNEVLPKLPEKKLPKTRKNATKNTINLPYGLCVPMDRRKYSLLDAQIPQEWERIVNGMSPEAAVGFISLLLAIPVDDATSVTAKTTPAAAKCLAGQAEVDVQEEKKSVANDGPGSRKTFRIANDTAVPLRRRLYFLPPGQPGAKVVDISEASIMKQLSRLKWLPCRMPSQADTDTALTLLRPEEAMLSPDSCRPDMPIVVLPPTLLKRLTLSSVAKALVWGTRAPPPPVTRLAELTREADMLVSSCTNGKEVDVSSISRIATDLISTWTAIARAHLRGDGLSSSDRKKLYAICEKGAGSSHCIPVRRALDAHDASGSWIVPVSRCVLIPDHNPGDNDREKIKTLTVHSFVASNFMCDFNHIGANPFFSQPDISAAVIQLANIPTLDRLPTRTLITTSGAFIRYCCTAEPEIFSRSSPLRASFSYAMKWCMESPKKLPDGNVGGLKLWVRRGPGVGSKALPARWVSVKKGPVRVVLDDDKTRARYSLLTPDMGIQMLGVLDHFQNERDCPTAEVLSAIDRDVVNFCGVMRLSDKRFNVKTKARGTAKIIDGASNKFQLICALLKVIELERISDGGGINTSAAGTSTSAGRGFLDLSHEPPPFIRHESLTREFQAPGMGAPTSTQLYAVWGRAPKHLSSRRCILVCGEPEDYSVELEQLVLNHLGVRSSPSLATTKEYRAALRLLSHLESEASFEKFLSRDFGDSEVTQRWRSLMRRTQILEVLKEAEEAKDAKALRHALVKAEEACEDDADEGDAVLKNARELLPKLEEEAKARQEAEEQKQKEAMEREAASEAALKEQKEAFEKWKQEEKEKALSKLAGDVPSEQGSAPLAPRGRGRGLTLPAWVTAGPGPKAEIGETAKDETIETETTSALGPLSSSMVEAKSIISSIVSEGIEAVTNRTTISALGDGSPNGDAEKLTLPPGAGRGRGISNLPAWMSSGPGAAAGTTQPGLCRGRGFSNLPAWMTNGTDPPKDGPAVVGEADNLADTKESVSKRSRADAPVDHIEEQGIPKKKARTGASPFEFSLKVSMEASSLPEFIAWLRPKVEDEAQRLNGSVTLERTDTET